ncbi:MAG: FAD-dependent oxidoreductase [Desulfopila sp.]|jgi:protoporphyrinogen oxidase|nr:FAD-dependent oxidoreductase [Desulfopila sp.]
MHINFVPLLLSIVIALFTCLGTPAAAAPVENHDEIYDVIIVGGGIAGLTAAFSLAEYDLLLLEKDQQPGGRAFSGRHHGISYAKGAEYLGNPETPLKEIIAALGLTLRQIPAPADLIAFSGRLYIGDYSKAQLLISRSSRGEYNRFAATVLAAYEKYEEIPDLVFNDAVRRLDSITARQWFAENNFSPIYEEIYNVAFRGLFGANIDEISALSVIPELAFDFEDFESLDEDDDLKEEILDTREGTGMYSFDGGLAEIPLGLARHLGSRLQTGTTVTEVRRKGEIFEVSCLTAADTRIIYHADSVILATPAAITLDIADSVLNLEQRQLLATIDYAPYATIALFSNTPLFNQGFDLAVPDGLLFTDIYDATWVARHYSDNPKYQEKYITMIYAAPQSYKDITLQNLDDETLMKQVLSQLDQVIPDSSKHVKSWEVTRFRFGYPVMTPGSYQRMARLLEIDGDGLFLAGDYLIYPTLEAAAASGQLAADECIDWLDD